MNTKKLITLLLLISSIMLTSCKKYLDVNPKSTLSEEQMFESEIGFQQALTGVYSQMASRDLYGDNLSMGFVSALAQNYAVSGAGAPFVQARALNYTSAEVMGYTSAIWNSSYSAIAGLNKVIENTQEKRNVLSDQTHALIRGEALGLRAYLHFELLRMFGPEFTTGATAKAVPYKTKVDQLTVVPSTTEEVVRLALADLTEAAALLKERDPIVFNKASRRSKMNYYAVKGLEARIRLYSGDKAGAMLAAQVVTSSGKFPFVTVAAASAAAGSRDRLYLPEEVFMIRVRDISKWADPGYFRFRISANYTLTRTAANFITLYETNAGGGTDIRSQYRIESDQNISFPSKFWQTYSFNNLDTNRLDQHVPLIRLSEMYYIMAEAAATPAEGVGYLNTVRQNRVLAPLSSTISQTLLNTEITKEYQKEFYAEGQLFYYYKRRKMVRMQFLSEDLPISKYQLPVPDSEKEYNPNY